MLAGLLRATAVVVLGSGALYGASATPVALDLDPRHPRAGRPATTERPVTAATLACPGQALDGADALRSVSGDVRAAVAAAPAPVLPALFRAEADEGRVRLVLGTGRPAAEADARVRALTAPVRGVDALFAVAEGTLAPGVVAGQTWRRSGGDDRGLAVAPCTQGVSEAWLVAGGDGAGRTERLVLTNPGSNAVTVRVRVLGATPQQDGATRVLSVDPRSRLALSVEAMAPAEPGPAVHVVASGGLVAAALVESWVDGAVGRGMDVTVPAAAPATDLVVPGLDPDAAAAVRVVNPGPDEAVVQVQLLTADGTSQPAALRAVRVPGGVTKDVPLGTVPAGTGAVRVLADVPVIAAVRLERRSATGEDRMGDLAWAPATPAVPRVAGAVLPGLPTGVDARLVLAATADSRVTVTLAAAVPGAADSASTVTTREVLVRAGTVAGIDLDAADRVWVASGSGSVHAGILVRGQDDDGPLLGALPVGGTPLGARSVPVRPVG